MSGYRFMALIALFTFALALAGEAVAGEKVKGRIVGHVVKWEQVEVGDEEGHVFVVADHKAIDSIIQGRILSGVNLWRAANVYDMNLKTGLGSLPIGYGEGTNRDGDKYYFKVEGKLLGGGASAGQFTFIKGTGKLEGIHGGGTWSGLFLSQTQWYIDWEGEVALSGR